MLCLLHSILDVGVDVDQGCEMSKQDLFKILKSRIGRDSESEVCLFLEYHCIVQTVYLGHPRSRGRLPLMPHATLYSIVLALSSSHRLHLFRQPDQDWRLSYLNKKTKEFKAFLLLFPFHFKLGLKCFQSQTAQDHLSGPDRRNLLC